MGFRKTAYAKVFVDEAIPSFLVHREVPPAQVSHLGSVSLSPALARPAIAAPVAEAPLPDSKNVERRNRSLRMRPVFLLRLIAIALLLNTALYALLNELPRLFAPATEPLVQVVAPPSQSRAPMQDVVTYTLPRNMLHYVGSTR